MENENDNDNNNNNISNNDNVYNSGFSYNSQPQQNIECITCKSSFESSPLLFSCNHHQCITCFTRKLLLTRFSALSLTNSNITFTCPCSSGSIELTLDEYVKILSSPQQIQPRRCSNHSHPYRVYCPDCRIWLCDQCLNVFHDDLFIHHTTTDTPFITRTNCTVHRKKTTERYCYQCNKFICSECIKHSNKHNNHATLSLKEYKRVIQKKQNKLKYHTYNDIKNYLDNKLESILNKYNTSIESIRDNIDNCIRKLEEIKSEYVERSEEHIEHTKKMFNIVKKVYEAYYKEYNESQFDLGSLEFLEKVNHELLDVTYVTVNVDALNKAMRSVLELQGNVFNIKFVFSNSKKLTNIKTIDTTNEISALCVLNNGNDFVTGHSNGLVSLYHSIINDNGKVLRPTKCESKEHKRTINTIKELTSSDNNNNIRVISCSSDKHINIWECSIDTSNIPSLKCIRTYDTIHTASVIDIIELSNNCIVSSGGDNSLKIWEMQSNNDTVDNCIDLTENVNYEKCLCKIDDNIIATGSVDRRVKIWNVQKKSVQRFLVGHTSYVNTLLLLKEKKKLISGDGDGLIIVWKLQEHKNKYQYGHKILTGHSGAIQGIALMNDNSQIVSCSNDKSIRVWDLDRLRCEVYLKECHKSVIYGIGVINENIIVSGGNDSCIKYFKVSDVVDDENDNNDYNDEDNNDDNYDDDEYHNEDDNEDEFEEYDDDFEEY